ncbi:MAG TPA: O-antigen ligase family protein [Terriglobia bacterium]|nr:O-antigen ligase family protein [Terriglobia bacterium]
MKNLIASIQKPAEIVLALVIIGEVLAFGGVQPVAYSFMEIVIFGLVLFLLVNQARAGQIQLALPIWPVLFAAFVVFQLIPIPKSWISHLDPSRLLPGNLVALEHRHSAWTTISIYPHATVLLLLKFLAYSGAFAVAAFVFNSSSRKSLLVRVLMFLGLFEAAYGMAQYLANWQKIFWMNKVYYTSEATGTYINHNHFAGFLELTFPFMLAWVFYYFQIWQDGRRRGRSHADRAVASAASIQSLLYSFLLVVAVVAVIFSRSRAGILATVFTVLFLAILAQLKTRRKAWTLGLAAFLLIAIGYGLWIGLNPVVGRFEAFKGGAEYLEEEGRLPIWKSTIAMIHDHPLTGMGLGTYTSAVRHYQTYLVNYTVTHAHGDFLELTAGTGLVGAALLFVPIFVLLGMMVHSFLTDPRRFRPAVTLGCIGGTLALLIHSVADFNLQIPANALVFAVVLGIGYKTCIERRADQAKMAAAAPSISAHHVQRKSHHSHAR